MIYVAGTNYTGLYNIGYIILFIAVRENDVTHLGAAVSMVAGSARLYDSVKGVIRMVQVNEEICVLEGTIDGLQPGEHALRIHNNGDLSQGCDR